MKALIFIKRQFQENEILHAILGITLAILIAGLSANAIASYQKQQRNFYQIGK